MFFRKTYIFFGIVTLIVSSLLTLEANSQIWKKVPGTLEYVNFLKFSTHNKTTLFVGSDAVPTDVTSNNISFPFFGYGMQISTNSGNSFGEVVLGDYSVFDIIESPSNPQLLLVSARKQDVGRVLLSSDKGVTWDEDTKRCESSAQISRFQSVRSNEKDIFHASMLNSTNGYRYSDDNFATCNSIEGMGVNSRDLAVSAKNPQVIYIAGDNVSKSRVMCSTDGGITWEDRSVGLLNYRILSIQTHPDNEGIVVVGADSVSPLGKSIGIGVYYSEDYGKNWRFAGAGGAAIYDIEFHPSNPKYWAAAGGKMGVYVSGTGGSYWESSFDGLPTDYFIRKVAIPDIQATNDGIIVYASVYGDGIYKSTNITTSISDENDLRSEDLVKSIYPNPATSKIGVFLNKTDNMIDYEIYDLMGNIVLSGSVMNNSQIEIENLTSGIYFIKFANLGHYQLMKFNKID